MKVLIATDGSEFSKAAVENVCRLIGNSINISFKVISAVERPAPIAAEPFAVSAEYYNEIVQIGRKNAKEFAGRAETQIRALLPEAAVDVTVEVLDGSPRQAIVERAKDWGADLIVVGSHGYGFWSRAMLGSVSSSVVHHALCSVLVVRRKTGGSNNNDDSQQ